MIPDGVRRIARDDAWSWGIMPFALDRIQRFCGTYDTDSDPKELSEQVARLFSAGDCRLGLWVIIRDSKVVAHMLAQPEPILTERGPWSYLLIRQAEADKGIDLRQDSKLALESLKQWSKSLGLNRIVMVTHRNEAPMLRRWGFQPFKSIMDMRI